MSLTDAFKAVLAAASTSLLFGGMTAGLAVDWLHVTGVLGVLGGARTCRFTADIGVPCDSLGLQNG